MRTRMRAAHQIQSGIITTADEPLVLSVPEPTFTRTWHPVSHSRVIKAVRHAVSERGLDVIDKRYTLKHEGMDLFASWAVDQKVDDVHMSVGFRNSMCKHFSLGTCAGSYVIVCSNMMFSAEFVEFRRHTGGLDDEELFHMANRAIGNMIKKMKALATWQANLKGVQLTEVDMKALTYDAIHAKLIPMKEFEKFAKAWQDEVALNGSTMYSWLGAHTRIVRDANLFLIQRSTSQLDLFVKEAVNRMQNVN